jgi:hypothetical protein
VIVPASQSLVVHIEQARGTAAGRWSQQSAALSLRSSLLCGHAPVAARIAPPHAASCEMWAPISVTRRRDGSDGAAVSAAATEGKRSEEHAPPIVTPMHQSPTLPSCSLLRLLPRACCSPRSLVCCSDSDRIERPTWLRGTGRRSGAAAAAAGRRRGGWSATRQTWRMSV